MSEASGSVHQIAGRRVALPCEVRDASSGAATFLVDATAARRLLPGPELDVVEAWPGRALLTLAAIDYRDNDLGDYHEVSVAFFVRERQAPRGLPVLGPALGLLGGRLPTWIHRLPVDQAFTCEAGRRIWGFPKTVDGITMAHGRRSVCTWRADGRHVLTLSLPRGGRLTIPDQALSTYTWIEGALHRTRFTTGARGAGFRPGGARLELGDHGISDELRSLGLPRRALMSVWMEHMHARFEAPEKC